MSEHPDVLIVGGGVIGLTTAWYLAGEGTTVTVVEQGDIGRQASWAGAGILPPAHLEHARTPLEQLRAHSFRLHAELARELREETGIDNGYLTCGGIELPDPAAPEAEPPTEEWHSEGVAFTRLDRSGLDHRWPELAADHDRGVWIPDLAQVRNPRHLKALHAGCVRRGVRLLTDWPVARILPEGRRITAVEGAKGRLSAGAVLLAAGAWSSLLLHPLGTVAPIRPIRGQMVLFSTGKPGIRPVLMQGKRYLVPRTDGRVLAGSTEEDVGFEARPTGQGVGELIALAMRLMPALADAAVEATWAGLRPGSPNGGPYLGQVPGWDNLHVAAGHFRAGLLLSPGTGRVMAQHLLGQRTLIPLEGMGLDRAGSVGWNSQSNCPR